ncbi:hypothetical protein ACQ4PT_045597 [Festuca glaucescens]
MEPLEREVEDVGGVVPPPVLTKVDAAKRDNVVAEGEADKELPELGSEGVGPATEKMDKVVWQDAEDSLPAAEADPEERRWVEARTEKGGLRGSEEVLSPTGSSVGSSVGVQAKQCVVGQDKEAEQSVAGDVKEDYFAVSVSVPERRKVQAQVATVEREMVFRDEPSDDVFMLDGSPRQSYTGPNSAMQLVPREGGNRREVEQETDTQEQEEMDKLEHERKELAWGVELARNRLPRSSTSVFIQVQASASISRRYDVLRARARRQGAFFSDGQDETAARFPGSDLEVEVEKTSGAADDPAAPRGRLLSGVGLVPGGRGGSPLVVWVPALGLAGLEVAGRRGFMPRVLMQKHRRQRTMRLMECAMKRAEAGHLLAGGGDLDEGERYKLSVRITEVLPEKGWYYMSCTDCWKKLTLEDGNYKCPQCPTTKPLPRYRFIARAIDAASVDSEGAKFADMYFFGPRGEIVVGEEALTLLSILRGEANAIPQDLLAIIGKEFNIVATPRRESLDSLHAHLQVHIAEPILRTNVALWQGLNDPPAGEVYKDLHTPEATGQVEITTGTSTPLSSTNVAPQHFPSSSSTTDKVPPDSPARAKHRATSADKNPKAKKELRFSKDD